MTNTLPPHHRYFQAKQGRWWSPFQLEITDPEGLRTSSLRWKEKQTLRLLDSFCRQNRLPTFSTLMDYTSRGQHNEVFHITQLSFGGITLFRSLETIHLKEDGDTFDVSGKQGYFPFLWWRSPWKGHGFVDKEDDAATYFLPWQGLELVQHTRMTPEGLEILQETPFSKAALCLRPRS